MHKKWGETSPYPSLKKAGTSDPHKSGRHDDDSRENSTIFQFSGVSCIERGTILHENQ
jgi:hypothetical protein